MFAKLTRNLVLALGLAGLAACASSKGATAAGGLKIVGDHIELDDAVYFETGKADIMASSHALLDRVAEVIKVAPDVGSVEIQGHTDNTGDAAANQALSEARAASVKTYLEGKGVTKKLSTKGYGQEKPLCGEDTDECRAKNRRVEFIISAS